MAENNQKARKGPPPKINLNEPEKGAPPKAPLPAHPFVPAKVKMDANASKKETARINFSSAKPVPKDANSQPYGRAKEGNGANRFFFRQASPQGSGSRQPGRFKENSYFGRSEF